jgi:hypothetical protein
MCRISSKPSAHEAGDGGLIAGGNCAVSARQKVIQMDLPDQIWRLQQNLGGPKRIAQVAAPLFQFSRQRAIEEDNRMAP